MSDVLAVPVDEAWFAAYVEQMTKTSTSPANGSIQVQDNVKGELRRQKVRVALRVRDGKTLTTALKDLKP